MAVSKNRQFAKIANDVATDGTLTAAAISSDVTLGGATIYSTRADLPASGNTAGDQAYVTENNRLYIWNGSGWYNVALLNIAPSITLVQDSDGNTTPFTLSNEGIATTITITALDSDGDPITYTAEADSDFNGLASISQDSSVFTITPFSQDSATTESGTITFKADDGVNIASSVNTFTLNFVSEYWDETALSIGTSSTNSLDNSTFVDRSTNAHAVTTSGTPIQTAFHPYHNHYSMDFDGNHSITVPTISSGNGEGLYTTGNSFTLEAWVYFKSWAVNDQGYNEAILTSSVASGTAAPWCLGVDVVSGTHRIFTQYWDGSVARRAHGDSSLELKTWHHLAWSVDSGKMRLFVDGVEETFTTNMTVTDGYPTIATPAQSTGWHIGQDRGRKSDMYIMNWRLVNGYALYTADFTPSETITDVTGTWMMLTGNNRLDKSSNDQTVDSYFDPPPIVAFNPFGQNSEYAADENKGSFFNLNGGNQYIAFPPSAITGVSGTAFTIELWINPQQYGTDYGHILHRNWTGNNNFLWSISSTGYFTLWFAHTGLRMDNSSHKIPLHSWSHIALVRDGNNFAFLLNGERIQTGTSSSNIDTTRSDQFYIGAYPGYNIGSVSHNAYFSDFKVTGSDVYDISNTTYTVPTSPVGSDSAEIYLPFDNAGIFDKTGNHTLTLNGDTSTSTTQTKFATTSMYFDGSDNISFDISGMERATTSNNVNTIEAWIYPTSLNGPRMVFCGVWNSSVGWTYDINSNGTIFISNGGSGTNISLSNSIGTNSWQHLAIVNDGTDIRVYLNGINVGTKTGGESTNYSTSYNTMFVGGRSDNTLRFTGYMENFQIIKGVAKYTTNFTPPTQEQGKTYQATS